MQFGAKEGEFGRYSQIGRVRKYGLRDFRGAAGTKKGFPIPWGDIPPRPFLAVTDEDTDAIVALTEDYLRRAAQG
jgi:phage gpG-like protein